MAIKGLFDTTQVIVELVALALDKYNVTIQLAKDKGAKNRMLYFECKRNLDLIEVVHLAESEKKIKGDDSDYLEVIHLLNIDIINAIFLINKENTDFYESLKELPSEEVSDTKQLEFKSIIFALAFLNIKIPVLKQLATLKFTGKAHKSIRFRKRLLNIKTALLFVVNELKKNIKI